MAYSEGKTAPGDRANVRKGAVPGTSCVGEELGKFEYLQRSAMSSKGCTTVTSQMVWRGRTRNNIITESQCKSDRKGEMWSRLDALKTRRAAQFHYFVYVVEEILGNSS